ncbi:glycosyltransferase family 2 protein [Dyadobacter arcticus]|uniref:Glycosyltransferase involved in cell wall biosynthesis n=1 Tax=Dyadobacter arcticus TaxID=1078754 RepID=A0ABX0UPN9_9BACT|nr:glycosyltransferase family 2 protein [Dyadobacter arcticus]NIJ53650.1 glycosyltransferase involved in cell wall biosynthesis [Dyadobacter arcticus]
MSFFQNPDWLGQYNYPFNSFDQVPERVFSEINARLDAKKTSDPLVTIMIAAWNEEVNLLRCVATLSDMATSRPFEILVVNNNSTDKTQQTIDALHVRTVFQSIQGPGPARQLGLENARGKYILLADADCFYPNCWLEEMMKVLTQPEVVCVYGRYSFISEEGYSRWQLALLEKAKDIVAEYRHLNRPYLNTYGISMGFLKDLSLKIGFVMKNVRGEDGRMAYALMSYGKIKQVKNNKARAWTGARTLKRDGSFVSLFTKRVVKEFKGLLFNLHSKAPKEIEKL